MPLLLAASCLAFIAALAWVPALSYDFEGGAWDTSTRRHGAFRNSDAQFMDVVEPTAAAFCIAKNRYLRYDPT